MSTINNLQLTDNQMFNSIICQVDTALKSVGECEMNETAPVSQIRDEASQFNAVIDQLLQLDVKEVHPIHNAEVMDREASQDDLETVLSKIDSAVDSALEKIAANFDLGARIKRWLDEEQPGTSEVKDDEAMVLNRVIHQLFDLDLP